ncbi:MAG: aminotransferase class III-fold pyridoxal phosphate-dependent enzyme [candidate division NC10 bacterium]|nr:aminotransferase class III-fold pyridoxal phosphate-dependent enzyme [candidate division NC10 bacterium]
MDPLANRMGFIPPAPGFLTHLREVTRAYGILVIFDEVISLRVGYTGAQGRYGGDPDLTAMGKIIGGGFPVGATGGKGEVMAVFDPGTKGPRILSGGTFSANPVTMTAGLAAIQAMDRATFARLEDMGARVRQRLNEVFKKSGQPGQATGDGSLFRLMTIGRQLRNYRDSVEPGADARSSRLFMALLDAGIMVNDNGVPEHAHERSGTGPDRDRPGALPRSVDQRIAPSSPVGESGGAAAGRGWDIHGSGAGA